MSDALERLDVEGVPTTAPFHLELLGDEGFRERGVHTRWVDEHAAGAVAG